MQIFGTQLIADGLDSRTSERLTCSIWSAKEIVRRCDVNFSKRKYVDDDDYAVLVPVYLEVHRIYTTLEAYYQDLYKVPQGPALRFEHKCYVRSLLASWKRRAAISIFLDAALVLSSIEMMMLDRLGTDDPMFERRKRRIEIFNGDHVGFDLVADRMNSKAGAEFFRQISEDVEYLADQLERQNRRIYDASVEEPVVEQPAPRAQDLAQVHPRRPSDASLAYGDEFGPATVQS